MSFWSHLRMCPKEEPIDTRFHMEVGSNGSPVHITWLKLCVTYTLPAFFSYNRCKSIKTDLDFLIWLISQDSCSLLYTGSVLCCYHLYISHVLIWCALLYLWEQVLYAGIVIASGGHNLNIWLFYSWVVCTFSWIHVILNFVFSNLLWLCTILHSLERRAWLGVKSVMHIRNCNLH